MTKPHARPRPGLLLLAALVALWSALTVASPSKQPAGLASKGADARLYERIVQRLADGEPYYPVAVQEHRRAGYPLRPFFVVRLPTLAVTTALLGPEAMAWLARGLLLLGAAAWGVTMRRLGLNLFECTTAAALVILGGFVVLVLPNLYHEVWCGLLLSLAAAAYRPGIWWPSVALALCAFLFREFALAFMVAAGGLALYAGRKREAAGWALACIAAIAFLAWHAYNVAKFVTPLDQHSPGWWGWNGPQWAIRTTERISLLRMFGDYSAGVLVILSLFGWWGMPKSGKTVATFCAAMILLLAIACRPDNYYWAYVLYPLLPVGLATFPRYALLREQPASDRYRLLRS